MVAIQAYDYSHPLPTKDGEWRTYVILGHGTPEGKTAYVLRLRVLDGNIRDVLFINPVTGLEYHRDEEHADTVPLKQVGCVISSENVWVNIQPTERSIQQLSWSLFDTKEWTPLFRDGERRSEEFRAEMRASASGVGGAVGSGGAGSAAAPAASAAGSAGSAAAAASTALLMVSPAEQPRYFSVDQSVYVARAARMERLLERKVESWREGMETNWSYAGTCAPASSGASLDVCVCVMSYVLCCVMNAACSILRDFLTGFERIEQKRSDVLSHEGQGLGSNTVSVIDTDERLARLKAMWSGLYGLSLQFNESEEDSPRYEEDSSDNPIIRV